MKKLFALMIPVMMIAMMLFVAGCLTDSGSDDKGDSAATVNTLSGTVKDSAGNALSGVTVTLYNASGDPVTATTGKTGNYSFTGVSDGYYTIYPSKTDYTFNPVSQNITMSGPNQTGIDFIGTSDGNETGEAGTNVYFPLKLDATWTWEGIETYPDDNETYDYEYSYTVSGTSEFNGKTYWELIDEYGDVGDYLRFEGNILYEFQGDYYLKNAAKSFKKLKSSSKIAKIKSTIMPDEIGLINFGVSSGATYNILDYSGSDTESGYTYTYRIIMSGKYSGTENVNVTAGSFSSCKKFVITITTTVTMSGETYTYLDTYTQWFAKNVGIVKFTEVDKEDGITTYNCSETLTSYDIP